MRWMTPWAAAAAMLALTGAAQAALFDRGGGMVYDSTLDLTWLADMNHAQTSGHTGEGVNADGTMTWAAATDWANNLVYGGAGGWRLPTLHARDRSCTPDPRFVVGMGHGCTGGELSHLFVADLGNQGDSAVLDQRGDTAVQRANLALFSNLRSDGYWSGTPYLREDPNGAWYFNAYDGAQFIVVGDSGGLYAVAVHAGDVAAIPEPGASAMLLAGLGTLAMLARRRRPH